MSAARELVLAEALRCEPIRAGVLRYIEHLVWVDDVAFVTPHTRGRVLRLGPVFVSEHARGRGVLRPLISRLAKEHHDAGGIVKAAILESSVASQRLFGACGFVPAQSIGRHAGGRWWIWQPKSPS